MERMVANLVLFAAVWLFTLALWIFVQTASMLTSGLLALVAASMLTSAVASLWLAPRRAPASSPR